MMSENGKILLCDGITKSYRGRRVVDGVSLRVRRGEIVGLLGPNGAGKTTTFYTIIGLVRPDSGAIWFLDRNISAEPMYRRARMGIGYLAQEPSVFQKLTVEENVLAILETLPLSRRERLQRAGQLLQELGLDKLAGQKAYTLSGGERRRLELTRALVRNPSLIMLDEPFSGVDPIAVREIQKIIIGLRERGLAILITDHSVRETLTVVDRAYLVCNGRILREGTSSFLLADPVSREMYLGWEFRM